MTDPAPLTDEQWADVKANWHELVLLNVINRRKEQRR